MNSLVARSSFLVQDWKKSITDEDEAEEEEEYRSKK